LILAVFFIGLFLVLWALFYAALPLLRRAGALAAHVLARAADRYTRVASLTTRYGGYLPIIVVAVAGAVLITWSADEFIDLAEAVHARNPKIQNLDAMAHARAVALRTPGATTFFVAMTRLGGPVGLAIISVAVAIVLAIKKRYRWLIYLAVTAGGGSLVNMELKRHFARARPTLAEWLRQVHGYSFPSGHAMGSTVVFGALSYLAFRTIKRSKWRAAALALAWTLIIAISLSRVYLGVHWFSDICAGIIVGTLWVAVTTVVYETLRRLRLLRAIRVNAP
jgi:undecaprenyl-diphosphatase